MKKNDKEFLVRLNDYGVLYYLVGVIEVRLRRKMIMTLRNIAKRKNRGEWFAVIPEERQFNNFLMRAINQNNGKIDGLEIYLPFLFWRNLFVSRNYTRLWTPVAHEVFSGLDDAISRSSFEAVQERIFIIHKIRNRVAHYDFEGAAEFDDEKEVLLDAIASNQWRLLDSEILADFGTSNFVKELVNSVTDTEILGPNGIRTLGKSNPRYRPGGYHTGSSWPMDAALIVRGLLRRGARAEATVVATKSIRAIEKVGAYPEFFRSDESEKLGISRFVIDVRDAQLARSNRICQPPQLLQGWTIAAFNWFKQEKIL